MSLWLLAIATACQHNVKAMHEMSNVGRGFVCVCRREACSSIPYAGKNQSLCAQAHRVACAQFVTF